jgi:type I restriction enzyme S subunit
MVKVSQEHIKDWLTPLPPVEEQKAIVKELANELTPIQQMVSSNERTIALLKERRATLIASAVTGRIAVEAAA